MMRARGESMAEIITGKQAQKAVRDILRMTGWSINGTARRLGWPGETLRKIANGMTRNPSQDRMDQLAEMLDELTEAVK
jgi:hypothetical protein